MDYQPSGTGAEHCNLLMQNNAKEFNNVKAAH